MHANCPTTPGSISTFTAELDVARRAAVSAGREIMRFYGTALHETKDGGSPVTAADHASNAMIIGTLMGAFPDDALLSEETADTPARLSSARVWIVDPLDGTKEFLAWNGEFSVMIALLAHGRLRVGVVYRPADDVLFWATEGGGAFREDAAGQMRLHCAAPDENVRVIGSRSHPDPVVAELCRLEGFTDIQPCGSVGLKCSRIAEGRSDLYVHPVPYMGEWDTAAPELILAEAGGQVTDCDGNRLQYNKADPKQPRGILAAHPTLAARVLPVLTGLARS